MIGAARRSYRAIVMHHAHGKGQKAFDEAHLGIDGLHGVEHWRPPEAEGIWYCLQTQH